MYDVLAGYDPIRIGCEAAEAMFRPVYWELFGFPYSLAPFRPVRRIPWHFASALPSVLSARLGISGAEAASALMRASGVPCAVQNGFFNIRMPDWFQTCCRELASRADNAALIELPDFGHPLFYFLSAARTLQERLDLFARTDSAAEENNMRALFFLCAVSEPDAHAQRLEDMYRTLAYTPGCAQNNPLEARAAVTVASSICARVFPKSCPPPCP